MSWKPFAKLRERTQTKIKEKAPERQWLDQVIVRQVTEADLPAMEWDGEFSHFRRVYAEAYQRMLRGYTILWVAELPGTGLIGQVFIQFVCDRPELADGHERAYLYSFRVRDAFRGHGVGSYIMDVVEDDLRMREFQCVTLNVARDNPRAQQLYLRRGYRVVAPEPGVWSYPDEKGVWHQVEEPAWRMEKFL
jgi:ribosomal protein S18 acetylase RimI-like enzyme